MAGLPLVQVLLDDGTGAFPYDITSYAQLVPGYKVSRGRQDELADVTPGGMSLVLDNADGRFTLGSTVIASPSPIQVDAKVRIRVDLVPNTTFETNVADYVGSNATLARSTAQAHTGAASMSITATAAANALAVDSGSGVNGVPVAGGTPYPVEVWVRAATVARTVQLRMDWWDAAGTFISTSVGTGVADSTGGWTLIDEVFTSPPAAAYARRQVVVASPAAGEVHYVDDFRFGWNRSTTYVQVWPVEWPSGGDEFAVASISGTDVQAQAQRQPLRSVIEEEVLSDDPVAYYTLGDAAGAVTAADSSGNQAPMLTMAGTGADVVFGNATGPGTDGLTAAEFAGGKWMESGLLSASFDALECEFSIPTTPAQSMTILGYEFGSPGRARADIFVATDGKLHTINTLVDLPSGPVVTDGLTHHLLLESGHVYLDGVDIGSPSKFPLNADLVLVGGGLATDGHIAFVGTIAHVAAPAAAVSAARAADHSGAGSTGFSGESGTTRMTRLAGYANLPVGTLDTSLTNVAFTDITGKAAAEAIRDVADAEFGLAFFDGSGNLTFHNRNRAIAKTTPDTTIDANFLAEGTQFIVDMQGVINYFEVTAEGTKVKQLVRDTVSEYGDATHPKHGRYPSPKSSYLVQTDAEALDRANWLVSTHSQPAPRIGSLVIDVLTMTADQQTAMLSLEPNSWLRVIGLPGQTPGSTIADFIVQGWAEAVNAGEWTLTINAANKAVAAPTPWILGHATYGVLGSTTRLYV